MIQRIQSLYLIVAVVAIVLCLLNPIGTFRSDVAAEAKTEAASADVEADMKANATESKSDEKTDAKAANSEEKAEGAVSVEVAEITNLHVSVKDAEHPGEKNTQCTPWFALGVLLALVGMMYSMAIFMYKKRGMQMRLVTLGMLVLVGYYIAGAVFVFTQNGGFCYRPTVWAAMPFVAIVLGYLAFRGINKDQQLINSLDRLR